MIKKTSNWTLGQMRNQVCDVPPWDMLFVSPLNWIVFRARELVPKVPTGQGHFDREMRNSTDSRDCQYGSAVWSCNSMFCVCQRYFQRIHHVSVNIDGQNPLCTSWDWWLTLFTRVSYVPSGATFFVLPHGQSFVN